jgi:hypothetical protein
MAAKRTIYLISKLPRKLAEWRRILAPYGIHVEARTIPAGMDQNDAIAGFLQPNESSRVLAVCEEVSNLYVRGNPKLSPRRHLDLVDHRSGITVWERTPAGTVEQSTFTHLTSGYVDRSGGATEDPDGWWDTIFRLSSTHLTYLEMASRTGTKISSRDHALSKFVLQRIHYPTLLDLNFNPIRQSRTVDFRPDVADRITNSPEFGNPWAQTFGLGKFLTYVLNTGLFFRAAGNRRAKNYWWPGLNGGIPLVNKPDPIHEITYQAHDFFHFLLPDLIFTGETDPRSRRVYIIYRMISEAVTLVLADMFFVESLRRSGVAYDFSTRKVHPLFSALGLEEATIDPSTLKAVLAANVEFCLTGTVTRYEKLLEGRGNAALEAFRQYYSVFFIQDLRWTARNFTNMSLRAEEFRRWWEWVDSIAPAAGVHLDSISSFGRDLNTDLPLVDAVFQKVWEEKLSPILSGASRLDASETRRKRAFVRYMIGQGGLFARFGYLPDTKFVADRIAAALRDLPENVDLEEIERIRAYYDDHVDSLSGRNLISLDDASVFKEIYPLFDPFFVSYADDGASLEEIARSILEAEC